MHSYAKEVSSKVCFVPKFQKLSHHVPPSAENLVVVVPKASKIMGLQHGNPDPLEIPVTTIYPLVN